MQLKSKNEQIKDKKTLKKDKKNKYTFSNKFYIILAIVILIIPLSICGKLILSSVKAKTVFNENMNTTQINISKNAKNIKKQYDLDGQKDKFLTEYNKVQNAVGMYIMNNSTLDESSFKDITQKINNILLKSDWKDLNIEKSTYWSGNWSVDDSGKVNFKFSEKKVEPNWISDSDFEKIIVKN